MDLNKVRGLIASIEASFADLKREISINPTVSVTVNAAARVRVGTEEFTYEPPRLSPPPEVSGLIDAPEWPEAVPTDLLCEDTKEDKIARAETLLDMVIETNLKDMRFLDYGCGDGYMAIQSLSRGVSLAVGYDPVGGFSSTGYSRVKLTDDPASLVPGGYDVILLYDVLDHAEYPREVLGHVARLLAPGGIVYAVCHPWTSRHGGHLYRKFNKAYAHLWLDDEGLRHRGLDLGVIQRVLRPVRTYRRWFESAGFHVRSEVPVVGDPLERFFRDKPVWDRLASMYAEERARTGLPSDDDIQNIFEIDFVNYTLQVEAVY